MKNDEQVTFDGIPIPLTLKTILDAIEGIWAEYPRPNFGCETFNRRVRQHRAFRERILRVDAENREEATFWKRLNGVSNSQIEDLQNDLAAKDASLEEHKTRIADLEAEFAHYQDQYHE